jgi:hypothetical protein
VKVGPSTRTVSIVEKIEGRLGISWEDGREMVEQTKFSFEDAAATAQTLGLSAELANARRGR